MCLLERRSPIVNISLRSGARTDHPYGWHERFWIWNSSLKRRGGQPLQIDDFDYRLPKELIAQHALPNRVDARLMVVDRRVGDITHAHVRDLSEEFLIPGDLLVLNNTRVIPARLVGFRTATRGRWQGLFLSSDEQGHWRVLGKTRGKLQPGETVTLTDEDLEPVMELKMMAPLGAGEWAVKPIQNSRIGGTPFEILDRVGRVPLPHYIRDGEMIKSDKTSYQTVFAECPGSVAAPTAGLHFSEKLLSQLKDRGIDIAYVTLHVGIGTFRPIAVENLDEHVMHSETVEVTADVVERIMRTRANGGRVIAVGTTTVRSLESASRSGELESWSGDTDLFIRPPFEFKVVDGLLTNFHLPKSSLLVLVSAFAGTALIRGAYQEAIHEKYRFFSYGDAMLLL